VTKYTSSKDGATFEETIKAPELFQKQTFTAIPKSLLSFLIVKKGNK
jgi:hypothetical protein